MQVYRRTRYRVCLVYEGRAVTQVGKTTNTDHAGTPHQQAKWGTLGAVCRARAAGVQGYRGRGVQGCVAGLWHPSQESTLLSSTQFVLSSRFCRPSCCRHGLRPPSLPPLRPPCPHQAALNPLGPPLALQGTHAVPTSASPRLHSYGCTRTHLDGQTPLLLAQLQPHLHRPAQHTVVCPQHTV